MNAELDELYHRVYFDETTKDAHTFINMVESKVHLIEKTDCENYEDNQKSLRLLSDYGIVLYNRGFLKKALHYLELAIQHFEKDEVAKTKDLLDKPMYESLVFHHGMTLYHLKRYKEAKADFKRLIDKYPGNDKYTSWINGLKTQKLVYIEWGFAIIAIVGVVLSTHFTPEDGIIERISFFILIIGFLGGIITMLIKKRITSFK